MDRSGFSAPSAQYAAPLQPLIVRAPLSCLRGISTLTLKNLPVSCVAFDDRKMVLTKLAAALLQLWDRNSVTDQLQKFVNRRAVVPLMGFDQLLGI